MQASKKTEVMEVTELRSSNFNSTKRLRVLAVGLAAFVLSLQAQAAWRAGFIEKESGKSLLHATDLKENESGFSQRDLKSPVELRNLPLFLREGSPSSSEMYKEYLLSDEAFAKLVDTPSSKVHVQAWPGSEMRALVEQGPTSNRINLTIVGDGYTASEKEKFFGDAQRITNDLFEGDTFHSYLPLFNVYAVFVPSRDSGITDVARKNTALGLFREPAGSKRAIEVGNPAAAERALDLAPATDYPILLANDDYYGGLGGRYAITTRSLTSGTMVLRHELGHNFGNVGEEYDGGYVYSGANSSRNKGAEWKHWAEGGVVKINEAQYLNGDYVWQNLGRGSYRSTFNFPGNGSVFGMIVSAVGWSSPDDVAVFIDGERLDLKGQFQADRSFFEPANSSLQLSAGSHVLEAIEQKKDGDNVLAFIQAHAYPPDYEFDGTKVGAYLNFNDSGSRAGYRPTHNGCLMREMRTTKFCVVDQENMWVRFLRKVRLIDELSIDAPSAEGLRNVKLQHPPLPGLQIRWFKKAGGSEYELTELKDKSSWQSKDRGDFVVRLTFETPEVRKASADFRAEKSFSL